MPKQILTNYENTCTAIIGDTDDRCVSNPIIYYSYDKLIYSGTRRNNRCVRSSFLTQISSG